MTEQAIILIAATLIMGAGLILLILEWRKW